MENLREKLNKKVEKEYHNLIEVLKNSTPEQVIERAYEKVTKEEIVFLIKNKDLEPKEIKALLKSNNLLHECYDEWLGADGNFNELIGYAVDDTIEMITNDFIADSKQKDKQRECR